MEILQWPHMEGLQLEENIASDICATISLAFCLCYISFYGYLFLISLLNKIHFPKTRYQMEPEKYTKQKRYLNEHKKYLSTEKLKKFH